MDATAGDESRDAIIGLSGALSFLNVVHVEREEEQIRIISAREATRTERKLYEDS